MIVTLAFLLWVNTFRLRQPLYTVDDIETVRRTRRVCVFFFFQAEDGIRDYKVTGVQTCALPISKIGQPVAIVVAPEQLDGHRLEFHYHVDRDRLPDLGDAEAAATGERQGERIAGEDGRVAHHHDQRVRHAGGCGSDHDRATRPDAGDEPGARNRCHAWRAARPGRE